MKCKEALEYIISYLENRRGFEKLENHIYKCPSCFLAKQEISENIKLIGQTIEHFEISRKEMDKLRMLLFKT